jgi:hypothetical protein
LGFSGETSRHGICPSSQAGPRFELFWLFAQQLSVPRSIQTTPLHRNAEVSKRAVGLTESGRASGCVLTNAGALIGSTVYEGFGGSCTVTSTGAETVMKWMWVACKGGSPSARDGNKDGMAEPDKKFLRRTEVGKLPDGRPTDPATSSTYGKTRPTLTSSRRFRLVIGIHDTPQRRLSPSITPMVHNGAMVSNDWLGPRRGA